MRRLNAFALLLMAVAVAGCTSSDDGADPTADARRAEYLLTAEPAGALGVVAARSQLGDPPAGDHDHAHAEHDHEHGDHEHGDHEHAEHDHADHEHEEHAHEHGDDKHAHDEHDHAHGDHAHDHAHDHDHVHNAPAGGAGQEMVVVGQIGGVPDPWDKEHAAFFIVDSAAAAEDHGHDHAHDHGAEGDDHAHDHAGHSHGEHENCPFCERAKPGAKSLAIVQFVDAEGKVLEGDARKLFDLKDKQVVVVKGRGAYDALGNLVISANGLYVRE